MSDNHSFNMRQMIADYMENGFLENIIDMFKHDSSLYSLIGELIQDERIRVKIGITAMMEELKYLDSENISMAVPSLLTLLDYPDPVVRGDVINLLGIVGDINILNHIGKKLSDPDANVRLIAKEAIDEIRNSHQNNFDNIYRYNAKEGS